MSERVSSEKVFLALLKTSPCFEFKKFNFGELISEWWCLSSWITVSGSSILYVFSPFLIGGSESTILRFKVRSVRPKLIFLFCGVGDKKPLFPLKFRPMRCWRFWVSIGLFILLIDALFYNYLSLFLTDYSKSFEAISLIWSIISFSVPIIFLLNELLRVCLRISSSSSLFREFSLRLDSESSGGLCSFLLLAICCYLFRFIDLTGTKISSGQFYYSHCSFLFYLNYWSSL